MLYEGLIIQLTTVQPSSADIISTAFRPEYTQTRLLGIPALAPVHAVPFHFCKSSLWYQHPQLPHSSRRTCGDGAQSSHWNPPLEPAAHTVPPEVVDRPSMTSVDSSVRRHQVAP